MKVLMVGATGKYASLVVPELIQRGMTSHPSRLVRRFPRFVESCRAATDLLATGVACINVVSPLSEKQR